MAAVNAFGFTPGKSHPNLVVCGVGSESELATAFNRLKEQGIPCCGWTEDDMSGEMTAVATAPLRGEQRKPLRRLKLLKT